jgi:hypothetical protein
VQVPRVVDEPAENGAQRDHALALAHAVAHVPVEEVADLDALVDGPARDDVREAVLEREDALALARLDVDPDVEARRPQLVDPLRAARAARGRAAAATPAGARTAGSRPSTWCRRRPRRATGRCAGHGAGRPAARTARRRGAAARRGRRRSSGRAGRR